MKSRVVSVPGYYEIEILPTGIHLTQVSSQVDLGSNKTRFLLKDQYVEATSWNDFKICTQKKDDQTLIGSSGASDWLMYHPWTIKIPEGFGIDPAYSLKSKPGYVTYDIETLKTPMHSCTYDQSYTGLIETFNYCKCGKKA